MCLISFVRSMPAIGRWYLFGGFSIIIVVHSTMFKVIALNGNELISRLGTFTEWVSNHGCNDLVQWRIHRKILLVACSILYCSQSQWVNSILVARLVNKCVWKLSLVAWLWHFQELELFVNKEAFFSWFFCFQNPYTFPITVCAALALSQLKAFFQA